MPDPELPDSSLFFKSILESLTAEICVIDVTGNIRYVNHAWKNFGNDNDCPVSIWPGVNYLEVCKKAAAEGDEYGAKALGGIRKIMNGQEDSFYFEYPCDSPDIKRWFMMRVTSLKISGNIFFVISHNNITARKLAEDAAIEASRRDSLTDLHNHKSFYELLNLEWRRCQRYSRPLSLAILDIDHFKLINDTYGHQAGDNCLRQIAKAIESFCRRPGDFCARFGGDEFAIVLADTTLADAANIINQLMNTIRSLAVPNRHSPVESIVTLSIGLTTSNPDNAHSDSELIQKADQLLYHAKQHGRNQVAIDSYGD